MSGVPNRLRHDRLTENATTLQAPQSRETQTSEAQPQVHSLRCTEHSLQEQAHSAAGKADPTPQNLGISQSFLLSKEWLPVM